MHSRHLLGKDGNLCNVSENCEHDANIGISVMALSLGVILALSVAANGAVCFVFYKKRNLLSVSNSLVLNLSVCQLTLALIVLPFTLTSVFLSGWVFHAAWCKIQGFVFMTCVIGIHLSLTVIALDRNYAIINSLRYIDVFTQRLANTLIASCWLLSLILSIPPLLDVGSYQYVKDQFTCSLVWEQNEWYLVFFTVVCFLLPLLIQGCCYLSIFKAAISHSKRSSQVFPSMPSTIRDIPGSIQTDLPSDSSDSSDISQTVHVRYRNMECKAVRTILLIAFAYAICWVPYLSVSFSRLRSFPIEIHHDYIAISFLFMTGIINPVIYVFMNRVTRREINHYFCDSISNNIRKSHSDYESDEIGSTTLVTNLSNTRNSGPSSSGQIKVSTVSHMNRTDLLTVRGEMMPIKEELEIVDLADPQQGSANTTYALINGDSVHDNDIPIRKDSEGLYVQRRTNQGSEQLDTIPETVAERDSQSMALENLDVHSPKSIDKSPRRRSRLHSFFANNDDDVAARNRLKECGSFLYFENRSVLIQSSKRHLSRRGRSSVDETHFRYVDQLQTTGVTWGRHHSICGDLNKHAHGIPPFVNDMTVHSISARIGDRVIGSNVEQDNTGSDVNLSLYYREKEERNCFSA